jgi:hypothetical protein
MVERIGAFPSLRLAIQRSPAGLPSSRAVPDEHIASGLPVMSIVTDEAGLYDPVRGILTHTTERGIDWEREATMSYFEAGALRYASSVGLRIHGGSSRTTSSIQSYRLYFRRKYGAPEIAPGAVIGLDAPVLRRIVVHNDLRRRDDRYWRLVNPLAYDIARRAGCLTVATHPVELFLNGDRQGLYVLSEFLDGHYFRTHRGHGDFLPQIAEADKLWRRISSDRQLTLAEVSELIDVDNLTRWFISVLIADTHDPFQAPNQFRDDRTPGARWFWINWDMDQSFLEWDHDTMQTLLERVAEPRRGRRLNEPRPHVFSKLFTEDEDYRALFAKVFDEVTNHRVTPAFLEERFNAYRGVAIDHQIRDRRYLERLRRFIERRPGFLRRLIEMYLNTEPSVRVFVRNSSDQPILVDGFPVSTDYEGQYLPGNEFRLDVPAEGRGRVRGWVIDGRALPSEEFVFSTRVRSELIVQAQFR